MSDEYDEPTKAEVLRALLLGALLLLLSCGTVKMHEHVLEDAEDGEESFNPCYPRPHHLSPCAPIARTEE